MSVKKFLKIPNLIFISLVSLTLIEATLFYRLFLKQLTLSPAFLHKEWIAELDRIALDFNTITQNIAASLQCLPVQTAKENSITTIYLYCPDAARSLESSAVTISERFKVSETLARQYNFWRRVYSLWSIDDYILHSSHYPEVIFEVAHLTSESNSEKPELTQKGAGRYLEKKRQQYRHLLLLMHRLSSTEIYTPAMKRIAALMSHIPDENKYLAAASSLRIQRGQRDYIKTGLKTASRYWTHIIQAFDKVGIPPELAVIAFVESSFNLEAHSKVGASGVFQLMPESGQQFLTINDVVDERRDPIKSAAAAAKILKLFYKITEEWPLAITSYNHGVGGVAAAVRKLESRDIDTIVKKYRGDNFGFASRNFYTEFLAMLYTVKNHNLLFPELAEDPVMKFSTHKLPSTMELKLLLRAYKLNVFELKYYNPDILISFYKENLPLPKGFVIKKPVYLDGFEAVNNQSAGQSE